MKEQIVSAFKLIDVKMRAIGTRIQTAVVFVALLFIYIVGIGLTKLLVVLFFRKHLQMFRPKAKDSYWMEARGYNSDEGSLSKQT